MLPGAWVPQTHLLADIAWLSLEKNDNVLIHFLT